MLRRTALKTAVALSCLLPVVALGSAGSYAGNKTAKLGDAAIIAIYNQVNSFDIETALVGQTKAHSSDVRALAEMVARDHTGVRKAAHELAGKIGVTPKLPAGRAAAAKTHYDAIGKLRAKSGAAFDRAYLLHEIEFHTAAMDAVKTVLLPAVKDPELKAHFETVLPHFLHHLNETKRIAKKLDAK